MAIPSYFWAISFRCQANKVSGVTMVAISIPPLLAQSPALIVVEAQSPSTELLAKNPILLAQAVNDLPLALIHPPGDGDRHNRKGSICGFCRRHAGTIVMTLLDHF
jgi:hypothetical protein